MKQITLPPTLMATIGIILWMSGIVAAAVSFALIRQNAANAQTVKRNYNLTWSAHRLAVCNGLMANKLPLVLGPSVWRVAGGVGKTQVLEKWEMNNIMITGFTSSASATCQPNYRRDLSQGWAEKAAGDDGSWYNRGLYTVSRYTKPGGSQGLAEANSIGIVPIGWDVRGCTSSDRTNPCSNADVGL